jgi:hypothetical protein
MPRIPDGLEHAVAFCYPTHDDAKQNARLGGSCFIVGKQMDGVRAPDGGPAYSIFAVSNRHVVWTGGAPVIRLNRRDGATEIIDLDSTEWTVHPGGDDLAAVFLSDRLDRSMQHLMLLESERFITEEAAKKHALGPGDHVFMIGRFINYQGTRDRIAPSLRFGSVSMMPTPLWNKATRQNQLGYAVEMRSRTGFSGSPVSAYRTVFDNPFRVKAEEPTFWGLLGVNWGYVLDEEGENTWLNGVVPAWKILELLEVPKLRRQHDAFVDAYKAFDASQDEEGAVPAVVVPSDFSEEEIVRRRDDAIRRALRTPPRPRRAKKS